MKFSTTKPIINGSYLERQERMKRYQSDTTPDPPSFPWVGIIAITIIFAIGYAAFVWVTGR